MNFFLVTFINQFFYYFIEDNLIVHFLLQVILARFMFIFFTFCLLLILFENVVYLCNSFNFFKFIIQPLISYFLCQSQYLKLG
jgi:hypothetical protein